MYQNPLLMAMQNNSQPNLKSLYDLYRSGGNPMIMLNKMAQSNPQVSGIMNLLKNGANPQHLYYTLCQQKGVDPNVILNQLNGLR